MQLKRWESPRRQGRNSQGKGGAARMRQLKKQQQVLRRKLKGDNGKGTEVPSLIFWVSYMRGDRP